MWNVIGLLLVGLAIAAIELPYLILHRKRREMGFFLPLLLFGVTISILHAMRVPLPNPLTWITIVFRPMSDATYDFLK